MLRRSFSVTLAVLVFSSIGMAQTVWYVDASSCPSPGSGTQNDPFCVIQDGITAASNGDVVLVLPGTYGENVTFSGKALTVTSEAGPSVTIIDGNNAGSVVRFTTGETDAILEGFTLTNGTGTLLNTVAHGGGIYVFHASPTIQDCVITGNTADRGAGIASVASQALITRVLVQGNNAIESGGGIHSGIDLGVPDTSRYCNSLILDNTCAWAGGGGAHAGGGAVGSNQGMPTLQFLTIANNSTQGFARGAIAADTHALMHPVLTHCILWDNGLDPVHLNVPDALRITWNDIQYSTQQSWCGVGCFDLDPLFTTPGLEYRVLAGSPCEDAGDPSLIISPECSLDLERSWRPQDGDGDGVAVATLGAYECIACPTSASWRNYGQGHPGSLGIPSLIATSPPVLGTTVTVSASNSLGFNTGGVLFVGISEASIPAWGGTLYVNPTFTKVLAVPGNGLDLVGVLPCNAPLCGLSVYLQILELDPQASHGISFSPGLELMLGS